MALKCCRLSWGYNYALLHNWEESKTPGTDQTAFFWKQHPFCNDSLSFSFCYLTLSLLLSTWDLLSNNSLLLVYAQDSCRAQCKKKYGPTCWGREFGFPDIQIQPSCVTFQTKKYYQVRLHTIHVSHSKVWSMLLAQRSFWRITNGLVNFYQ